MGRFALFSVGLVLLTLAIDGYVYVNWRRFARPRPALRWTLAIYRVLLWTMPLALPGYFLLFRWWEVEPKLARALFFGLWAFYYVPKVPIALVLLLKDGVRLASRLMARLRPAPPAPFIPPTNSARRMSRAEFLQKLGWSAAALPFLAVGHGVLRTLYDFTVHRVTLPIPDLPRALDGLTIGQISDLHAGSFFDERPAHEAVELLLALKPDLVVITGDYVNHDADELPIILPALRKLKAELGVWGCLGNHDHYAHTPDVVRRLHEQTPLRLLINAHHTFQIDGARLHLIGTDNTGFRQRFADLPRALQGLEPDPNGEEFRLLLAHDPTFWDLEVRPGYPDIDLMLCGHTHGGQIGVELGPLRWGLARLVYQRWAGLYVEPAPSRRGRQYLYVNRGVGTVGPPLRLGIRPEITLVTLRRA